MKNEINRNVIIVLIGGILFHFASVSCNSVEPDEYSHSDDYMIYSKVLSETITEKDILIVLQDSTQQEDIINNKIEYFLEHNPEANRETLNNYVIANESNVKLKRISGIQLIFQSEYDKSIKNVVNVSLSNVGYNSNKTEAFVSVGALYAPLVGGGSLIFLVKLNNQWQIRNITTTWIA